MLKKIFTSIVACLIILLALFFVLTVLVRYQNFFGQLVTLVLCACTVVLMLFVVYIMISWVLDAVRSAKQDEDRLSEKSLEKLLSGKGSIMAERLPQEKGRGQTVNAKEVLRQEKRAEIAEKAARKRLQYTQSKIAVEEIKAIAQAKSNKGKEPELATAGWMEDSAPEPAGAKALAEEQSAQNAQELLPEDVRRAEAVASARKQAEAAAAARRRAAQAAARTQSFSVADIANFSASAPQVFARIQAVPQHTAPLPSQGESIWDKMQVRQSAAPVLSSKTHIPTAEYGARPAPMPPKMATGTIRHTGVIPTGSIPAIKSTAQFAALKGTQPIYQTMQGMPNPQKGQPQQAAFGRAVQGPKPPMPVPNPPAPPRPLQTQPLQSLAPPRPAAKPPVPSAGFNMQTGTLPRPPLANGPPPAKAPFAAGLTSQIPAQSPALEDEIKRPRGRPPKPKDPEEENKPKRPRGRPPKPKDPEEENKPKRPRGRPPKPKDPEEENKPKRPRGRPRKTPLEGEELV